MRLNDRIHQATSTQRVLDAVQELHALEQIATRETIADLTGLKLTIVDDRLGVLVDEDRLRRVQRGVYVPVEAHPPARAMSKTVLPDGCIKIEIGDEVLTLTPKEDRALAMLQAGAATQAVSISTGRQASALLADLLQQVRGLARG